jgi:hypothetical protein
MRYPRRQRGEAVSAAAELTALWASADSSVNSYVAALLAKTAPSLPKAAVILAISLAAFIAFVAVYSATTPPIWQTSRFASS